MIELHTALIEIGREVEKLGEYRTAIKIAEAAIVMNEAFALDELEDIETQKEIGKLLSMVIKRIEARARAEGKSLAH